MKKGISYLVYGKEKMEKLEELGKKLVYPKNFVVAEPDVPTPYCYVVKKGCVVSYEYYINGEKRLYRFHEKDALFLEANVLFDRPPSMGFKTTCKTELIGISKADLTRVMKEDGAFALKIMEATSDKFFNYMEQVRYEKNHDVTSRICDLFLDMSEYYGVPILYENKILIRQKMSQQLISEMLGVNRITVVRIIKKLKEMGLLDQEGKNYIICDKKRLEEFQHSGEDVFL